MKQRILEIAALALFSFAVVVTILNAAEGWKLNREYEEKIRQLDFFINEYENYTERLKVYEQERKTSYFAQY